jgi:MFS family permease
MLVTIFFIAYLIFEVPSNLVIPKIRPSWYIAGLAIVWGSVLVGMSQAKTNGALLACRFLLGAIEAGFLPGVLFIMTCWYKNHEIGKSSPLY